MSASRARGPQTWSLTAIESSPVERAPVSRAASETSPGTRFISGLHEISGETGAAGDAPALVANEFRAIPGPSMRTEELYPSPDSASLMGIALRLLGQGVEALNQASHYIEEGRPFDAEHEISSVRALLPELLCCRKLGDGFGQVVVAVSSAISHHASEALDQPKVIALKRSLVALKEKLALTSETAADIVIALEDAGLRTELAEATALLEALADESLR